MVEYIEEYDEQCEALVRKLDKGFKVSKDASDADKQGILLSIKRGIKELREVCTLYKSDLYMVPRAREAEFKVKYDSYVERLGKYDRNALKLEMIIKKDEDGLAKLENEKQDCFDEEKMK